MTRIPLILGFGVLALIFYAYASTWGKTELEIRIHINESLVRESAFGESPTFAIWLENHNLDKIRTVFATYRAAKGDWEGKAEVPVALPRWFEVRQNENSEIQSSGSDAISTVDAFTGATPEPGYFIHRTGVSPGSMLTIWMEVNLAGDFNDSYREYDEELMQEDLYRSGQPALLYRAEIEVSTDSETAPILVGMSLLHPHDGASIEPLRGITTAHEIFDQISIKVVKPKPRILKK